MPCSVALAMNHPSTEGQDCCAGILSRSQALIRVKSARDGGYSIALDPSGDAVVSGFTYSAGWVSGGSDTAYNGGEDAFVARISAGESRRRRYRTRMA